MKKKLCGVILNSYLCLSDSIAYKEVLHGEETKHNLFVCVSDGLDNYGEDIIAIEVLAKWRSVDNYIKEKKKNGN